MLQKSALRRRCPKAISFLYWRKLNNDRPAFVSRRRKCVALRNSKSESDIHYDKTENGNVNPILDNKSDLGRLFPFKLDSFQVEAAEALDSGVSLLVTAPTGSGKTVIAEIAIQRALACGKRVIYTTPIKALSNQKLLEFQGKFGKGNVGLITGDVKYQTQSNILVMTTEILRNMLYVELGNQFSGDRLKDSDVDFSQIQAVVLDEVHYLGDQERGTVWEECIIYLPKYIQMVCLSATLSNADEIVGWFRQVHGPTSLITSKKRPVPLSFYWTLLDVGQNQVDLEPFYRMDNKGGTVIMSKEMRQYSHLKESSPKFKDMLMILMRQNKLPAIWFIFRRRACDAAAVNASISLKRSKILKDREQLQLYQMLQDLKLNHPESVRNDLVQPFLTGIASHHAGLLPAWKAMVEQAFQCGLIKLVFATHSLATGINMPAKTTVLSELEWKRGNSMRQLLMRNEIMQLAGRAGRRGFDKFGNCILLNSPSISLARILKVFKNESNPIKSSFKADYGMVLNLIESMGETAAKELLKCSFLNYQCQLRGRMTPDTSIIDDNQYMNPEVRKLKQYLSTEKKMLDIILWQTLDARSHLVSTLLEEDFNPSVVSIDYYGDNIGVGDGNNGVLAIVYTTVEEDSKLYYICVTDNCLYKVTGHHIGSIGYEVDPSSPLSELVRGMGSVSHTAMAWTKRDNTFYEFQLKDGPPCAQLLHPSLQKELAVIGVDSEMEIQISEQRVLISELEEKFAHLAAFEEGNVNYNAKMEKSSNALQQWLKERNQKFNKIFSMEEEQDSSGQWHIVITYKANNTKIDSVDLDKIKAKDYAFRRVLAMLKSTESYEKVVEEFDNRVRVLAEFNALDLSSMSLKPLGNIAMKLKCDNQLALAMALTEMLNAKLSAEELSGVTCALITRESIRLRPSIDCYVEPSEGVINALDKLEPEWENLSKTQMENAIPEVTCIDSRLAGIAEQWAAGVEWEVIKESVALDEGDIVKILHRTQDMLRQFSTLKLVTSDFRETAQKAVDAFEKAPLTDM